MDIKLQISKTQIDIGLNREYRFFQLSDAHIAYIDEQSSDIDIRDNARSTAGWKKLKVEFATQFAEHCDESYDVEAHTLLELLTEHAIDFDADAVIFSGDIMDRVTDSNIRYLKGLVAHFPRQIIYCPGNHASHDEYGNHRNMYDRFKGLIDSPEIDVVDFGEFEIVTVDNGAKQITDYQLTRLKEEIDKGKKILLVLHAPLNLGEFGEQMRKKISGYFLLGVEGDGENAFKFIDLIKENDKSFIAVLAGHIHTAVEYPITDNLIQYTASSALIGYGREIIIK